MGKRLYVGNLPYDADEAALRAAFAQDGRTVERVHIVLDRETQRPRGFAFVEMATDDDARAAITAMDGVMLGMRQIRVTEAEERRSGPGGPRAPGAGPGGPRPPGGAGRPAGPGGGPGGGARPGDDGRGRSFGPDARPAREREREMEQRRASQKKRSGGGGGDEHGGRRGNRHYDDDDE